MKKDKKWLLNEIRKLPCDIQRGYLKFRAVDILPLIEQLDEPEKVVIPQFVAEWIEECQKRGLGLGQALDYGSLDIMPHEMKEYIKFNFSKLGCGRDKQELVARAWLDGYEIEKEKLYRVIIPTKDKLFKYYYLDDDGGINMVDKLESVESHTEEFIRSISDDLWQFAVEVAE